MRRDVLRRAPAMGLWVLVALGLLAVVGIASTQASGGPPERGGPPGHGGHPGRDGEHGPPGKEHSGQGHNMLHGMGMGGGMGRPGEERDPPPSCSTEDSHNAFEASSEYISCTEIDYADFVALVQADLGLMEGAALCIAAKADEIQHQAPNKDGDVEVDLDKIYQDCVNQVANNDQTKPTAATAAFLEKLVGPDSKVCRCLPAYVEKMPLCDHWARFHGFGVRVQDMCDTVHGPMDPPASDAEDGQDTTPQPEGKEEDEEKEEEPASGEPTLEEEEVPEEEVKTAEHEDESKEEGHGAGVGYDEEQPERPPHIPDPRPPCPPGEEPHTTDPTKCQPISSRSEDGEFFEESRDGRGPPPGQGGALGFVTSLLGVIVIGSLVGIAGVWLWSKFQSGTRQPGVRYMATGMENDMGTELGPFGREYP